MTVKEKIELIEELMDIDEGTLTEESVLEDFDEWDSLSKLALMAEVKKKFDKRLTVEEIGKFKTVKDICDYMD